MSEAVTAMVATKAVIAKKPGWKTTEFWLSLATVLLGALMASGLLEGGGDADEKVVGLILSALAALGYTGARSLVKHTETKAAAVVAANMNLDGPSGG